MSAAMLRAWLDGTFYQARDGMDTPWLRLAGTMEVRLNEPVEAVRDEGRGVTVVTALGAWQYDGVVLAIPAPAAQTLLGDRSEWGPAWLGELAYAPQVRLYAARRSGDDVAIGMHVVPADVIASVEFSSGRHGAWGACPADWQWALVCAHSTASQALLGRPVGEVMRTLWEGGRAIVPALFPLEEAAVTHLSRWEWAVPIMRPGHIAGLHVFTQRPPLVYAGDWLQHACVEGAVRSSEAAAAVFGSAA